MDKASIFHSLASRLGQGEITFPTSAQVAMQVRRALDDPDCPLDTAVRLVQAEPLLSARVVAVANSTAFNPSGREITDIRAAVTRLGFRMLRTLATALLTRELAGARQSPQVAPLAAALWEHTAHVAALAHVIARRVTRLDAETALFAGVVHEIAGFYLLSRVEEFPGLLEGELAGWKEQGEVEVGSAILTALGIPEPVIQAIATSWDGFLSLPPTTLADTLLLAEELAPVPSPLYALGIDQPAQDTARIDMAVGDETLAQIMAESAEEIASLTAALQF